MNEFKYNIFLFYNILLYYIIIKAKANQAKVFLQDSILDYTAFILQIFQVLYNITRIIL